MRLICLMEYCLKMDKSWLDCLELLKRMNILFLFLELIGIYKYIHKRMDL